MARPTNLPRRTTVVAVLLVVATLTAACAPGSGPRQLWPTDRELELGRTVLLPYLAGSPWANADSSDAFRRLLLPLHAAFEGGDPSWRAAFHEHFARYDAYLEDSRDQLGAGELAYAYLATRYLVLADAAGEASATPDGLRASIERRLGQPAVAPAARDETLHPVPASELVAFGIAGDLATLARAEGTSPTPVVSALLDEAANAIEAEGLLTDDGRWMFLVAPDTPSAALRPVVISSLIGAEPAASARSDRYRQIQDGLSSLAFSGVFIPGDLEFPGWRTRTHMSPAVGIRMSDLSSRPTTRGPSADFSYGLWAFLGDRRAAMAYFDQSARFPLSEDVLAAYLAWQPLPGGSPVPTDEFLTSGFAELSTRMAARVATGRMRKPR